MATPEETIDTIIANALDTANEHTAKVEHYADFAVDIATGGSPTFIKPYPWDTEVQAVEPDVPTVDTPTTVYETERDELIAILSGQLDDFFTKYYPLVNDAYDEATAWLVNTITNGGTGIPSAIEDQIWQRGRGRVITENKRSVAQVASGLASRGFSMPSGALNKAVKEIEVAGQASLGEMSTSVAIKQVEIEIENIKFAVEKALNARMTALGAAADYIRSLAIAPEIATKLTETDASVQARMMSATADLYRARLSRDELVMKTEVARMSNFQGDQQLFYNTFVSRVHEAVNGTMSAADAYAKTAQAALSSLNTMASTGLSSFG